MIGELSVRSAPNGAAALCDAMRVARQSGPEAKGAQARRGIDSPTVHSSSLRLRRVAAICVLVCMRRCRALAKTTDIDRVMEGRRETSTICIARQHRAFLLGVSDRTVGVAEQQDGVVENIGARFGRHEGHPSAVRAYTSGVASEFNFPTEPTQAGFRRHFCGRSRRCHALFSATWARGRGGACVRQVQLLGSRSHAALR